MNQWIWRIYIFFIIIQFHIGLQYFKLKIGDKVIDNWVENIESVKTYSKKLVVSIDFSGFVLCHFCTMEYVTNYLSHPPFSCISPFQAQSTYSNKKFFRLSLSLLDINYIKEQHPRAGLNIPRFNTIQCTKMNKNDWRISRWRLLNFVFKEIFLNWCCLFNGRPLIAQGYYES